MTLTELENAAATHHLCVFGVVKTNTPETIKALVLFGPAEPGFWPAFKTSPEFCDGAPNPLDRWSKRVIDGLAQDLGGQAFFPFSGPPFQPFIQWAQDSGRAHVSPVGLLVHDTAGLMASYRGAIGFSHDIDAPIPGPSPCDACSSQPCRTACPVGALAPDRYDVAACKADLDRPENNCMTLGCAARRACPVSQSYGRQTDQSAFHMRSFK